MSWGKSFWLDAVNCDHEKIINYTNIQRFAKELCVDIDMIPFRDPIIHHFGSGDKQGYSLVQLIETSNICAHFAESTDSMFLDVFSCKDFRPEKVVECAEKFFGGKGFAVKWGIQERGNNFPWIENINF